MISSKFTPRKELSKNIFFPSPGQGRHAKLLDENFLLSKQACKSSNEWSWFPGNLLAIRVIESELQPRTSPLPLIRAPSSCIIIPGVAVLHASASDVLIREHPFILPFFKRELNRYKTCLQFALSFADSDIVQIEGISLFSFFPGHSHWLESVPRLVEWELGAGHQRGQDIVGAAWDREGY